MVAVSFLVLPHVITTATTLVDNYAAGNELQAFQTAQPYVPSLAPGAKPPAAAPASVITQLQSIHEPGTNALAQILQQLPEDPPEQPGRAPGFRCRTALRTVDRARRTDSPAGTGGRARAAERHGRAGTGGARRDPPGLRDDPQPGRGRRKDSGLARWCCPKRWRSRASTRLGPPSRRASRSRAREIAKVADPNLRQVLDDELLLVPPGTEAPALLRFQPLASAVQAGKPLTNAQIATVGAADLESLLRQRRSSSRLRRHRRTSGRDGGGCASAAWSSSSLSCSR